MWKNWIVFSFRMKNYKISYTAEQQYSPMTFWVHETGNDGGTPPPPLPVRRFDGYPYITVEFDGFTFEFASLHEMRHLIQVFEKKVLPQTRYPENHPINRNGDRAYANRHWLSRLPSKVKSEKFRNKTALYLRKIMPEIEQVI